MVPKLFDVIVHIWLSFFLILGFFFTLRFVFEGAISIFCHWRSLYLRFKPAPKPPGPVIPGYALKTLDGEEPNPSGHTKPLV